MDNSQQRGSHLVHLKKAKKGIDFMLFWSVLVLITLLLFSSFSSSFFIQLVMVIGLVLASQLIYIYPIIGTIVLGGIMISYLHGWYKIISGQILPMAFGLDSGNLTYYLILIFRSMITLILTYGLYYSIKGMIEKEQFEKSLGTLDEEEL